MIGWLKRMSQLVRVRAQGRPGKRKRPTRRQFVRSGEATIREHEVPSQKIIYLNVQGEELPFEPAWCITDTQLIFSLSPQNVRAFLSHDPAAGSMADLPAVAARIKEGKPVLLSYQDTAGMMKITYPVLQIFATIGFSQLQREGFDLDAATLPSLASLVKHVEPGISTLSREKDGFLYLSRQSLPIDPTISGVIPLSSMFFLVSLGKSRPRGQRRRRRRKRRSKHARWHECVQKKRPGHVRKPRKSAARRPAKNRSSRRRHPRRRPKGRLPVAECNGTQRQPHLHIGANLVVSLRSKAL